MRHLGTIVCVVVLAAIAWTFGGGLNHASRDDPCVIVVLTGNKLCGDDAVAWCDSTDALRQLANDPDSQDVCDELRGIEPGADAP